MADTDTIKLTQRQLRRLLTRFAREVDAKGGKVSDSELEQLATRLLDEISPTCELTGAARESPMLNSNVVIKVP
jgi:hypothetical protein